MCGHLLMAQGNPWDALEEVLATEDHLRNTIFSDQPQVQALICENEGKPLGFAVYFFNYSTWLGKLGLFLEDLYVSPDHRGVGALVQLRHKLGDGLI